eukprot:TRINITY_DN1242_c0_g1_i15.p1 TRINITY_DN1242_c0_g1~~TRINITY_DN1242_c0_g1_i15.p1  ORF type:complete len:269 (+),score=42.04 TRINITY_DN1242_c0_g1_i15:131-937(+)
MLHKVLLLFSFTSPALFQSDLYVSGSGSLLDGSSAAGVGVASGKNVLGIVEVSIDETTSSSSVVLSASGKGKSTQKAPMTKTVKPAPKASKPKLVKPAPKKVYTPPSKVYVKSEPKCEDLKGYDCYKIDEYKKCGFCVNKKYPTRGYGCSYVEEIELKHKGASKKEYDYETVITPKCHCDGVFISDKYGCPTKPNPKPVTVKKEKPAPKPVVVKKEEVVPKPIVVVPKVATPAVVSAKADVIATAGGKGAIAAATATATASAVASKGY